MYTYGSPPAGLVSKKQAAQIVGLGSELGECSDKLCRAEQALQRATDEHRTLQARRHTTAAAMPRRPCHGRHASMLSLLPILRVAAALQCVRYCREPRP